MIAVSRTLLFLEEGDSFQDESEILAVAFRFTAGTFLFFFNPVL